MNIFKVLATRKRFPEEMASAILGWLLHPNSEHGLGRAFLVRFISALKDAGSALAFEVNKLSNDDILCNLEEDVGTSQIDIILFLGDHILAIENKIHDGAFDFGQLEKEYNGLIQKFPDKKIVLVYLVPNKGGAYEVEYNRFISNVKHPHKSALLTWSVNIQTIISDILLDNSTAHTASQRTINTLEMLREFIMDRFKGYNFMHRVKPSDDYLRLSYSELLKKEYGFVGVENGVSGLKKLSKESIQTRMFPYDLIKVNVFWIPLNEFLKIVKQKLNEVDDFHTTKPSKSRGDMSPGYMGKFNSSEIYEMICKEPNVSFYIGIKGGERAFSLMDMNEVKQKKWQITTGEQPNSQWITGNLYKQIYEQKYR